MAVPYPDAVRNAFKRARNMDGSLNERLEYFAKAVPMPIEDLLAALISAQ